MWPYELPVKNKRVVIRFSRVGELKKKKGASAPFFLEGLKVKLEISL